MNTNENIAYQDKIDTSKLPEHIAIIMDGNGRWAKAQGKHRIFGHKNGVKAVREVTEGCAEIGIKNLTLYAFSTENWNRPKLEVSALMELLFITMGKEIKTLQKNNIRLNAIGHLHSLPESNRKVLLELMEATKNNTRMTLTLALSYGAREELTEATKKIAQAVKDGQLSIKDIKQETIMEQLYTKNIPDPELMIRTSGEHRISNFLLWQMAYTELYFTEKFWPEFTKNDLYKAIYEFQNRERRFGMTSEQINEQLTTNN
ncbi:MAG TPA: isoprenyl transferase [Chitinophagales bacterium]|nr:isoprenyl transferase [Chitinophagales bacterium]HMW12799.1 isoprenyl transferase [Chitinophagales bacterium]HMX60634.1 isoprenyl transferase [Chitinophagales bacterium]HMY24374.1 isoprenyl transferase [Chitinophagales bacterium]HMZ34208.1 isoprenyl transferase [Chitinophagales bacterium]